MSGLQSPQEKTPAAAAQAEAPFVPEAASPAERARGWKNPPSRMQLMLWSGSRRHVFAGLLGVSVLATIPWVLLTSGKKHDSHADYMDRAEGARRSRLSNVSAANSGMLHSRPLLTSTPKRLRYGGEFWGLRGIRVKYDFDQHVLIRLSVAGYGMAAFNALHHVCMRIGLQRDVDFVQER